ncbi:phytoene desaturase family protein [Chloroflexota bacterium]
MAEYDVVVAGGGHNGLIVAAYLAKAGLSVCVVEKQEYVGGGVVTREVTLPGFKHDLGSLNHSVIHMNPLLERDELGLFSKYGLEYVFPEAPTALTFPDGRSIILYRDIDKMCSTIEQFSRKDADTYRRIHDWGKKLLEMSFTGLFSGPPPLGPFFSVLEQSEEGQEMMRAMLMSGRDTANEWFESDEAKMLATRFGAKSGMDPQVQGNGFSFIAFVPFFHKCGCGVPVGGSGVLSDLLAKCLEDDGGTIRTSSTIKKFKVEGGEAKGVILDSGEEILAKRAVVTGLSIRQLPGMLDEGDLPSGFASRVNRLLPSCHSPLVMHLALNEAPNYGEGNELNKVWYVMPVPATTEQYYRGFDGFKYGEPAVDFGLAGCSTIYDPSRAPDGKHTLYLFHFEPYNLKGGAERWDEVKEEVAQGVLDDLRKHTNNMGDENILGKCIFSPYDFARYNPAWVQGDHGHIGAFFHQTFAMRPIFGWGQYRMPPEKLYLCGPSAHPGGGVTGGSRSTAVVIMEELGIDFEKVIK